MYFVLLEGMGECKHEDADGCKSLLTINDNPIPRVLVLAYHCAKKVLLSVVADYFLKIFKQLGTLFVLPVIIPLVYGN